jgi:hypothetical protein
MASYRRLVYALGCDESREPHGRRSRAYGDRRATSRGHVAAADAVLLEAGRRNADRGRRVYFGKKAARRSKRSRGCFFAVWLKPELSRLYVVLAAHGADPAGFTPEYWLKRSLAQAREQGEKYAELCAARDLGQLYARRGEHQNAREVLDNVASSFAADSDELVVRRG